MQIPDIKLIEAGTVKIEPAPREYKKKVLASLISIGCFIVVSLTAIVFSFILERKQTQLEAGNQQLTSLISFSKKILNENADHKKFYEETQNWIKADAFFSKALVDISDCIPESSKVNGLSLARDEKRPINEAYILTIKTFPMKNTDAFVQKTLMEINKKNFSSDGKGSTTTHQKIQ